MAKKINEIKVFALTAGDPSSIASYLTLKTYLDLKHNKSFCYAVVANKDFLEQTAKYYNLNIKLVKITNFNMVKEVFSSALPVYDIALQEQVTLGVPNYLNVPFILESINIACNACLIGNVSAVITNPFSKEIMKQNGFNFDGHTEYIHHFTKSPSYNMMLTNQNLTLKTIPIFIHKSLKYVLNNLSYKLLYENIVSINNNFKKTFGFAPKIALAGLNPHAGENGNMGFEEIKIINPCCKDLRFKEGINISDALPPDTLFVQEFYKKYDLIVTIYHDQALAPFKALCFNNGVNTTIGLSIIRTSPDHGTAYNLVHNKELISNSSLISAFKVAYLLSLK